MPFIKGQSGNPKGRPKKVKNKKQQALEELLTGICLEYFTSGLNDDPADDISKEFLQQNFSWDINFLSAKDRVSAMTSLLKLTTKSQPNISINLEQNQTKQLIVGSNKSEACLPTSFEIKSIPLKAKHLIGVPESN